MKKILVVLSPLLCLTFVHSFLYWKKSDIQKPGSAGQLHLSPAVIAPEFNITARDLGMDETGSFPVLRFQQKVSLENETIELAYDGKTIRIDSCSFPEEFLPYFYRYKSPVLISNCTFGKPGEYSGDHPPFGFTKTHFQSTCHFELNRFYRDIYFDECEFDGNLQIDADNTFVDGECTIMNSVTRRGIKWRSAIPSTRSTQPKAISFDQDTIYGILDLKGFDFSSSELAFSDTWIDSLNLENATFGKSLSLRAGSLQTRYKQKTWAGNRFLRFLLLPYSSPYEQVKTALDISNVDLDKISIDYNLFKLYFPSNALPNDRIAVYKQLLDKYTHTGEQLNYKQVDIDLHNEQGGIFNDVSRWWWNYGYSKGRILLWTSFFLLLFTVINFFNLSGALSSYDIKSVSKWLSESGTTGKDHRLRKVLASLLYTSGIFFGIKLDFDKLVFTKLAYSIFILFQFLIGLVCTGFIVNLIFSK